MRLRFASSTLTYEAGETTDRLAFRLGVESYSGTFPHVVPTDDAEFMNDGNFAIDLAFGPLVITNETDPARSETVIFSLHADHRVIPRLPPP